MYIAASIVTTAMEANWKQVEKAGYLEIGEAALELQEQFLTQYLKSSLSVSPEDLQHLQHIEERVEKHLQDEKRAFSALSSWLSKEKQISLEDRKRWQEAAAKRVNEAKLSSILIEFVTGSWQSAKSSVKSIKPKVQKWLEEKRQKNEWYRQLEKMGIKRSFLEKMGINKSIFTEMTEAHERNEEDRRKFLEGMRNFLKFEE
jgi:hypothetical protein